jgi:carboxyl-terminal processing protease
VPIERGRFHDLAGPSRAGLVLVGLVLLLGCGGGGSTEPDDASASGWTPGVFPPAASFRAQCASPRSGTDPSTGASYPDVPGSTLTENNWLRSWSNDRYLWYSEIVDRDPASYSTPEYFDLLKTTATTASGAPRDKFHFTYPTTQWQELSQSGVQVGYGAEWAVISSRPPRLIVVAYTEPGSPATAAGLARGAEVVTVDGADAVNAGDSASVDTLNGGLYPAEAGETHVFGIRDLGSSDTRTVSLQATKVTAVPVQNVSTVDTPGGRVGYMLFNDHVATAEQALVDAIDQLQGRGITDLVLDIRYNGGGFLAIASELAYMIAGPGPTAGQTFEQTVFNDKYPNRDPFTGEALTPMPFLSTTVGLSVPADQPLPTLNLPRVYTLTGPNTCSASESIMNGLRGVGVEVIQIGSTTCGKPYGFYPTDNCGTTYFSINFKGVNARGFGDYSDGFSPSPAGGDAGAVTPGCPVSDDFSRALGDPREARFATALDYRRSGGCPDATAASRLGRERLAAVDGLLHRPPWRENRLLWP